MNTFLRSTCTCLTAVHQRPRGWSGWFQNKVRKINHTSSALSYFMPSLLKAILGQDEPIEKLVYEPSRNLLFTKTKKYIEVSV